MNDVSLIFRLVLILIFTTFVSGAQAAENVPSLFVTDEAGRSVTLDAADINQSKTLRLDKKSIALFAGDKADKITVIYAGRDVVFHKTHSNISEVVSSWSGKDASGETDIVLTLGEDHLFGRIHGVEGEIQFEPGEQAYETMQTKPDVSKEVQFLDDGIAIPEDKKPAASLPEQLNKSVASGDNGQRIDVMVLYTSGMAAAYPGSQILTRIHYLVYQANLAFSNSRVNTYLRLVHSKKVIYPDTTSGGMARALNDLTENKGVFKGIEKARTTVGADQVTLLRRYVDEGCGFAWVLTKFKPKFAYAVTHDGYKTDGSGWYCSRYSYAHEIGHNLGAAHDRANANTVGMYNYSYGYQNPSNLFRTVMAYNCTDGCPHVAHFSNPNIQYEGKPTGILHTRYNAADNARTINQTRVSMARYRAALIIPAQFSLPAIIGLLLSD